MDIIPQKHERTYPVSPSNQERATLRGGGGGAGRTRGGGGSEERCRNDKPVDERKVSFCCCCCFERERGAMIFLSPTLTQVPAPSGGGGAPSGWYRGDHHAHLGAASGGVGDDACEGSRREREERSYVSPLQSARAWVRACVCISERVCSRM